MRRSSAYVALALGCGSSAERSAPAGLAAELTRALGVAVSAVQCPVPGPDGVQACTARAATVEFTVVVEASPAGRQWRLAEALVATAPLAAFVQASLGELGLEVAADCGPPLVRAIPGTRVACALPDGGVAWATLGEGGSFRLDVALDAAQAAARAPSGDLEAQSRALDRDDEVGEDDLAPALPDARGPGS